MQQIGRNYYNPKDSLSIPQHRLIFFLYRTITQSMLNIVYKIIVYCQIKCILCDILSKIRFWFSNNKNWYILTNQNFNGSFFSQCMKLSFELTALVIHNQEWSQQVHSFSTSVFIKRFSTPLKIVLFSKLGNSSAFRHLCSSTVIFAFWEVQ